MAEVNVVVAGSPPANDHPHVSISGGRRTVTLPSTAPEYTLANLARTWKQVERPGELYAPVLARSSRQLTTITLEVTADAVAMGTDVERLIAELVALSDATEPLVVAYGTLSSNAAVVGQGTWRLTGIDPSITAEEPVTNRVTAATIRLTLTEASDIDGGGGVARVVSAAVALAMPDAPRRYTVRAGESLPDIAARFYGRADLWRALADANSIRDPSPASIAGSTLTIF